MRILAALAALCGAGVSAAAMPLLRDINRTVNVSGEYLRQDHDGDVVPFAGGWLLSLCTPEAGCLPWFTDGTALGTHALNAPQSSNPLPHFAVVGATAYFGGSDSRLWRTDGTVAGTAHVFPSGEKYDATKPGLAVLGNAIFYAGTDAQLHKFDGATDSVLTTGFTTMGEPVAAGGNVFFVGIKSAGFQLWQTDGASAPVLVKDLTFAAPSVRQPVPSIVSLGGRAYFCAMDNAAKGNQWATDGTPSGTQQLASGCATSAYYNTSPSSPLVGTTTGKVFFMLQVPPASGASLWITDGTTAGTALVRTLGLSLPVELVAAGPLAYFIEFDGTYGAEVWRSDGTPAGTFRVSDTPVTYYTDAPNRLVALGDIVYFRVPDLPGAAANLWRTDGTVAGTTQALAMPEDNQQNLFAVGTLGGKLLVSFHGIAWLFDPASASLAPLEAANGEPTNDSYCADARAVLGSSVYFFADDGIHGCELWRTDGTEAGTQLVKDAVPGYNSASPADIVATNDTLYFSANVTHEIWKSDGTGAGTVLVKAFAPQSGVYSFIGKLVTLGNTVLFPVLGPGQGLWKSDGTDAGTMQIGPASPWVRIDRNMYVTVGNVGIFFSYEPPTSSTQPTYTLWRTDATPAGTFPLFVYGGSPMDLAAAVTQAYLVPADSVTGFEPWRADGALGGTRVVRDIVAGPSGSVFSPMSVLGDVAIFQAADGQGSFPTWRSDGTAVGTFPIALGYPQLGSAAAVLDGRLYYISVPYPGFNTGTLMRTDGTSAGTATIVSIGTVNTSNLFPMVSAGGSLFFVNGMDMNIWLSTGRAEGTLALFPYPREYSPVEHIWHDVNALTPIPTGLFTFGNASVPGREPYFLAFDATPGPMSFPSQTGVFPNATITSAAQAVTGINVPANAVATGGELCVSSSNGCACDVSPFAASAPVRAGQYVCVRHRASSAFVTATTTTLSVGTMSATFTSTTMAAPDSRLAAISSRLLVLTGDNVAIGGFIVGGTTPKTVVVRARGPALGVAGQLADPTLTLVPASGPPIFNDDWATAANAGALAASSYAPTNAKEAAIMATLAPGAYTGIVAGAGGTTGVGIFEVYEIDHPESPLVGISTRGAVRTGDDVMIGGFIIQGASPRTVIVRARGPSLAAQGVSGALANPTLTLVSAANGSIVGTNDDWGTAPNAAQIADLGLQPASALESAILATLPPGPYTAIVSGVNRSSGVAIVEVYGVP